MAHIDIERSPLERLVLRVLAELCRTVADTSLDALHAELARRGLPRSDSEAAVKRLLDAGSVTCDEHASDTDAPIALTEKGRNALQRVSEAGQFNIRLPLETREALRDLLPTSGGTSLSALAAEALREWTRMERFPGVDFRWSPNARQPFVSGTGLTVWELHHVWIDHDRDVERVLANYPHLEPAQIARAVAYSEAHLHEMPAGSFGVRPTFAPTVTV